LYCGIFFTESGWVWIGDGGDAGGSVGGSGNGGPTSSPTVSPTPQPDEVPLEEVATVCPDLDPTCRVRPDTAQIRMMEDAFNSRFVSRFEYADSAVRAQCDTARNALQSIMGTLQTGDGPIWVGTSDAEPGTYLTPHEAEANQAANRFHLDPAVFDSIRTSPQSAFYSSKLLTLMLHERLHLDPYRFTHPVGDSILRGQRTAFASGNTYQVDPYFGPINSTAQGYRCVKF
ncbi:MAG: hypothetical protein SFU57_13350, partial [Gemmatimonadales bacterium]|nr:hypothetical protein [Gemmatimonadales bacterium]